MSDSFCTNCGKFEELRPYGKNEAEICFACGMLDEPEMKRRFLARLASAGPVAVLDIDGSVRPAEQKDVDAIQRALNTSGGENP